MGATWWAVSGSELPLRLYFEISADAFLYHMVRSLVHGLVRIGQGNLDMEILSEHLAYPGRNVYQGLAPAQGLTLVKVSYPDQADED